jgi:hypothetical protein
MKAGTIVECLIPALLLAVACGGPTSDSPANEGTGAGATAAESQGAVASNPFRNAYFGETHVHGAYSLDAYIGGARLEPDDQYLFAKGEPVTLYGKPHTIGRALDFVALSDHAEYIGEMYSTIVPDAPGHDQTELDQLRNLSSLEERRSWFAKYVVENNRGENPQHPPFFTGFDTTKSAWKLMVEAAERHNDPGRFTALIGFEWSAAPGGANLHRNVIFRDSHVPDMPVSSYEVRREDQLWEWMAQLEAQGMQVLAIPHNSNASKGMMFPEVDAAGDPIDLEYARTRQRYEPLIEMMQIKGNSEVHRNFWAADEFADFENADSLAKFSGRTLERRNFVRWGLEKGLAYQQELEANPFKYGFIGGTDNHNGASADVVEGNWPGSHGPEDGSVDARRTGEVGGWAEARDLNPGSLAAVWATANTRAAIFDAMKRRETFVTSGPRIKVRFFGGVDLPADPSDPRALVEQGYELGVPMGSDLEPTEAAPTFTVHAMKDPDGANLDRIQIIKGWVDAEGGLHEKIVDVVWSDDRAPNSEGKLPSVGNTVDLTTAKYTNTIGASQLMGSWTDDDFDPAQHAMYYVRVLEIPTPRWSTYDAVRNGLPLLEDVPATIQERAWTSPIWYTP